MGIIQGRCIEFWINPASNILQNTSYSHLPSISEKIQDEENKRVTPGKKERTYTESS